jgi:hypothetical protein
MVLIERLGRNQMVGFRALKEESWSPYLGSPAVRDLGQQWPDSLSAHEGCVAPDEKPPCCTLLKCPAVTTHQCPFNHDSFLGCTFNCLSKAFSDSHRYKTAF